MITFDESIPTACPYCGMLYNTYLKGEPDSKEELGIEKCHACNMPYVVRQEVVLKVTTHRIDGLQPVEPQIKLEDGADIPLAPQPGQLHCDNCTQEFDAETMYIDHETGAKFCMPCYNTLSAAHDKRQEEDDCTTCNPRRMMEICGELPSELKPTDDIQRYTPRGTHPDPETHHCQECGLIYSHEDWCFECGTCKKCAEHLDFKELKEMVAEAKKAEPSVCEEKNEIQFTQIFGNVWAAISGESVHLKYGNSKCGIWDRTIFDTLLEMTDGERRKEIDELVEGMSSKQQRKACLRQFTIALEKGEVSFPEVA